VTADRRDGGGVPSARSDQRVGSEGQLTLEEEETERRPRRQYVTASPWGHVRPIPVRAVLFKN
jgi:hypothetical protein